MWFDPGSGSFQPWDINGGGSAKHPLSSQPIFPALTLCSSHPMPQYQAEQEESLTRSAVLLEAANDFAQLIRAEASFQVCDPPSECVGEQQKTVFCSLLKDRTWKNAKQ